MTQPEALGKILSWLKESGQHYIVIPNLEILVYARTHFGFRSVINAADLSLPVGFGLLCASKVLGGKLRERVTGSDLTFELLKNCEKEGIKVAALIKNNGLSSIAEVQSAVEKKFPKINFKVFSSNKAAEGVPDSLREFAPELLLVSFGFPYQEVWLQKNLMAAPSVKVGIGVGGAMDFLTGAKRRSPKILSKIGLEWVWRLLLQPKRIWRIFTATIIFPLLVLNRAIRSRIFYRKNVMVAVQNKEGNIFIGERMIDTNHWQLPQGGIDKGETLEDAGIREMSEEIGITNSFSVERIGTRKFKYDWPWDSKSLFDYDLAGQQQK